MKKLIAFTLLSVTFGLVSPATSRACACCETWQVTGVDADDNLNIRSGPGTRFRVIGSIPSGSACVIKTGQCRRNWCRISYAETKGWVSNNYLRWKN